MSDGEGISGIYVDDGNIVWLIDDYGTLRPAGQEPMTYTAKAHTVPQENAATEFTRLLTEANETAIALARRCDELERQVNDLMGELANVRAALSESDSGAGAGSGGDSDGGNPRGLGAQALLTLAAPTHRLGKGNE
jgi:hypothetical protein